jgi:hypothetical protein
VTGGDQPKAWHFLPELALQQARSAADENVGMVDASWFFNAIWIPIVSGQPAGGKRLIGILPRKPDHDRGGRRWHRVAT